MIRTILGEALDPEDPEQLAAALSQHFDVDLLPPERHGAPRKLAVVTRRSVHTRDVRRR